MKEYLEEWKALRDRIARIEQEIDRCVGPFEAAVKLWESMPGVDHTTACNLVAEVGANMDRLLGL